MPLILVKNRVGGGHKWAYRLGADLPPIIEEPSNVTTEESESKFESSGYAVSECEWSDESYSDVPTVLNKDSNYEIYNALLSTITLLQQSECSEFKHYKSAFNHYLKDYSTYNNHAQSFLEKIKEISSARNNESVSCCCFFKKEMPVNTETNKLVRLIIHPSQQNLANIHAIQQELAAKIAPETNGGRLGPS